MPSVVSPQYSRRVNAPEAARLRSGCPSAPRQARRISSLAPSNGQTVKALPSKVGTADPYIAAVRVAVNRPNVVRVVFDLRAAVESYENDLIRQALDRTAQEDAGNDVSPAVRRRNAEVLKAFRAQLEHSIPTPNTPAMKAMWSPSDLAIGQSLGQGIDPATTLKEAQQKLEGIMAEVESAGDDVDPVVVAAADLDVDPIEFDPERVEGIVEVGGGLPVDPVVVGGADRGGVVEVGQEGCVLAHRSFLSS